MKRLYFALFSAAIILLLQGMGQTVHAAQIPKEEPVVKAALENEETDALVALASDEMRHDLDITYKNDEATEATYETTYIIKNNVVSNSQLPVGISYDASQNVLYIKNAEVSTINYYSTIKDLTICLENSKVNSLDCKGTKKLAIRMKKSHLNSIYYNCSGDLSIEVNENNQLNHIDAHPYDYKAADIHLGGTGTIETTNEGGYGGFIEQTAWHEINEEDVMSDGGDYFIEGITLIIHDGEGIVSCNSNVTIKNAIIKINDQASTQHYFGITTGLATYREGECAGLLTIDNSEIEIKKCTLGLAWNRIRMTGCHLYMGESSPEYQIDPAKAASYDNYGDFKRWYYEDINYLKITKDTLKLPEAHAIINGTDPNEREKGYITLPAYAVAGQKVNVEVQCWRNCVLSKLYVNGKEVSGTSFFMPNQEATVKSVFAEGSTPSTGQEANGQNTVKVTRIKIRSSLSNKIAAGKKVKLIADVFPSNAANKKIKWTSSNPKIASVNASGTVTMKKKTGGKSVTITATAVDGSSVKATYKITSMKGIVKKVTISGKKTVKAGKTLKLKAKVTSTKKANKKLKWTSSNTKYATVNSSGKVKALKKGKGKKVKITAMATDGSGKKKSVTIKIK